MYVRCWHCKVGKKRDRFSLSHLGIANCCHSLHHWFKNSVCFADIMISKFLPIFGYLSYYWRIILFSLWSTKALYFEQKGKKEKKTHTTCRYVNGPFVPPCPDLMHPLLRCIHFCPVLSTIVMDATTMYFPFYLFFFPFQFYLLGVGVRREWLIISSLQCKRFAFAHPRCILVGCCVVCHPQW